MFHCVFQDKYGLGHRHFLTIMGFLGIFNIYTMRINLSVAIVAMVKHANVSRVNYSDPELDVCPLPAEKELSETAINATRMVPNTETNLTLLIK